MYEGIAPSPRALACEKCREPALEVPEQIARAMIENGVPTICERCQGRDEEQYDPEGLRRLLDALAAR